MDRAFRGLGSKPLNENAPKLRLVRSRMMGLASIHLKGDHTIDRSVEHALSYLDDYVGFVHGVIDAEDDGRIAIANAEMPVPALLRAERQ